MANLTPSQLFKYGIGLYVCSWVAWFLGAPLVAEYTDMGAKIALASGAVLLIFPLVTGKPSNGQQNAG